MQRNANRRVSGGLGRAEVPPLSESPNIPSALSDRVNQLIQGIRPGGASERRRHGIADYVRRLIVKCFHPEHKVEAFMFGSVPLRTYLPDGDIDVSIFCEPKGLQEIWCDKLSSVLESEAENPDAEYKVANVSLINAEVKLLKCLVDNIVVDVSFNQIGGLCTLNFLEAMDRKIAGKHLFKKSIILIKAWCYYESRVLGAQHSLLSTYALETMVLHIFNVYHSDLRTPLEVLYKFLIVFHHFQWDSYCLTLSGPISLKELEGNSVPTPPDQGKTLLIPTFMNVMLESYAYTPVVPANSKGPGYVKYMNIMDPLLHSNNLGRSVSKTSEIRIKNAFGHGARALYQLFKKDVPEALEGLDAFFKNTWLAQQRPRISPQLPLPRPQQQQQQQPSTGPTPAGMKSGNGLLELLKDPHKNIGDPHDRDSMSLLYGATHGLHAPPAAAAAVVPQPQPQVNGNVSMQSTGGGGGLGGIFLPSQGSRPADDKTTAQASTAAAASLSKASELEKLGRQLFPAQHMRNLFEMQAMKNDPGQLFSAFAQVPMDSAHVPVPYPAQLYNSCQMKFLHHAAALRGRSEGGLQRAKSEPNITELCLKKKEKIGKKYCTFQMQQQQLKNTPPATSQLPAAVEDESKTKSKEGTSGRGTAVTEAPGVSKPLDVTAPAASTAVKAPEVKKTEKTQQQRALRELVKLPEGVLEKLNVIEAKLKVEEQQQQQQKKKASELGSSDRKDIGSSSPGDISDTSRETEASKDETSASSVDKSATTVVSRNEVHEQSIVVGEPPEPAAAVGDFPRVERDFSAVTRSQNRRNGRPFDLHQGIHTPDVHVPLIQMAHGQSQRQSMARMGMSERQMPPVMEAGPNGEFPAHLRSVYPYYIPPAQFPQMVMYNMLSAQEGVPSAQMTLPRGAGIATSAMRHPGLQKIDGRAAIVDLFPGSYHPWYPGSEGVLTSVDRRMTGSLATTLPVGWNNLYASVNGAGPSRPPEDILPRDSDDVLSGDIETLTQQLEVARNFIGCKTPAPSGERDRSSRSSSSGHTPERNATTGGGAIRKSTPSPTVPSRPPQPQENRTSSRERQGRHPMENQAPFNPVAHVQTAAPVAFPANFTAAAAQSQNLLYPVHPSYVTHQPPPPGAVSDRMTSAETELLNQQHVATGAPGFGFQPPVRSGVHVPVAAINAAGHVQGTVPHAVVDSTMQLPPQPPRSASPGRGRDAQVIRSSKAPNSCRFPTAEGATTNSISLPIGDGTTVEIDASVFQAVKAAMAENASDDHASRDPNNRVPSRDPNSPRHFVTDGLQRFRANAGGGVNEAPVAATAAAAAAAAAAVQHSTSRRQLEEGVMCFSGPVDLQSFQPTRQMTDMNSNAANGTLAHFFTNANQTPSSDAPLPQRTPPASYGTGGFIPIHAHYVSEQRKAREQQQQQQQASSAEKETQAQGNDGNVGEDGSWSPRSFSNASEKTEHNDSKSHPRGRMSPSTGGGGPQWSTSASSNRSFVHTPPRGFNQHDIQRSMPTGGTPEGWSVKEERKGMTNHGDLKKYYQEYGEVANSFVPAEAGGRMSGHAGGTFVAYPADNPSQQGSQGYSDFSSANSFHSQNGGHHRYPIHGAMHGQTMGIPRNRREGDRWGHHPRNDKSSMDRSSTPDSLGSHSLIRRSADSSEPKRMMRNHNFPAHQRILEPFLKPVRDGGSDEDGLHQQGRSLEQLFGHARQSTFRGQSNVRHRNRRGSPRDDRARFPLKDADFPALDSARPSKRPSSPSSQSGTPKASEKHLPASTR